MTTTIAQFKIDEPIEIRIKRGGMLLNENRRVYVLACWVGTNGMIGNSLSIGGEGRPEGLANLGSRRVFPHKAVPGWQQEVIDFVNDNTYGYTIEEYR